MKIKNSIFLLVSLLCLSISLNAQTRKIYSIATDSNYCKKIIYYDYDSKTDSTVFSLYNALGDFHTTRFLSTSDPYNGRYFIGGYCSNYYETRIFTYDIPSDSLTYSNKIDEFYDTEYDIFFNRIIYRTNNKLYAYNLSDETIDLITDLPYTNQFIYGNTRAIDPVKQQFYYEYYDAVNFHLSLVDIENDKVLHDTIVEYPIGSSLPTHLVFDVTTNNYYGMVNNGDIAKTNIYSGDKIITRISDWDAGLNEQQSVFDYTNSLYIVPYHNKSKKCMLATVNVLSGVVERSDIYPISDYNELFADFKPLIRIEGNLLRAVYGKSYQWFLNGIPIDSATDQTIKVKKSGYYKVNVTFFTGRSDFSDSIYCYYAGLKEISETKPNILVYPNPFSSSAIIDLSGINTTDLTLSIYNSMGQLQKRIIGIKAESITIEKQNLGSGFFFFKIESKDELVGQGKFIVE